MKTLQSGLIVTLMGAAIALAVLFASVQWTMAQSVAPDQEPPITDGENGVAEENGVGETSAIQAVGLLVTATVGTVASECATSNTVQVLADTLVYYCFTVQHTGVAGDEQLTFHNLRTSRGPVDRDLSSAALTLNPGEIRTTFQAGFVFTDAASVDVTNFITWTARPADNEPQVVAYSQATIDIVNPALEVIHSVGLDRTTCPVARTLRVPSGQSVAFYISLHNTGEISFTTHTLTSQIPSINATFNYTLAPGQTLNIIPTNLASLGITNGSLDQPNVTSGFANNVSVTSRATNGLTASGTALATVDIGITTVGFSKIVSTDPENCTGTSTIVANPGTMVYYCVVIQNTGVEPLTHHRLTEQYLSIDVSFDYSLAPGETLRVTNEFLKRNNQPIVFGPFELHPRFGNVINNTMTYQGSSPDGLTVTTSAGTTATFPPTPTITLTPRPDNTSTSTPAPTSTPTDTPTSTPVTPSPTPTDTPVTPSPTPTRSYAITLLETPTPRTQIAGVPEVPQQDPLQPPTPDPLQPPTPEQQVSEQPPLGQDPVLATATQMAVDATATAIAAIATASQLAIDSASATALAEAQAQVPDSPLPTPTIDPLLDPSLVQDGSGAETPIETPTETPTETATVLSVETLPTDSTPPGTDVTVLPPLVTAVIATETPAVVLLVVTNTPQPGEILPEGQRPIILPTPTSTPDFVMAAARTFDVAVTTMGWLWFLVGSLVFFVTAGIVAGLFFRQSEANRFGLPEPDYWLEGEPQADRSATSSAGLGPTSKDADDDWPADLP